jgi:hypothetical protein
VFGKECEKCGGTGSIKAAEALVHASAQVKAAQSQVADVEAKLRGAEAEIRQLKRKPTEDEWLEAAPPSIKTLIEKQKKQEADTKAQLVETLRAAQDEYTEDELKAMELPALERLARAVRIETTDFSAARPVPRHASSSADDVYANPPDPYAEAIKRMQGKAVN